MPASDLQVRVRGAIASLGGYWKPANAAIRLLEELGELAEHTLDPLLGTAELAGECADLWIISTALADQFYAYVDEPQPLPARPVDGPQQLAELVAAGGRIGRIINYYDGPKVPRSLHGWLTLEQAVAAFHGHLVAFARANGVDLIAAIDRTLGRNVVQDAGRFAPAYDPRTAPVLERFAAAHVGSAAEQRLFGAPDWIVDDPRDSVAAIVMPLQRFLRAREHERLDGFVIGVPPSDVTSIMDELTTVAPTLHPSAAPLEAARVEGPIAPNAPGWTPTEDFVLFRSPR